eukprot:m.140870 g.140870  ORF g.140870 m.140870 type:complete len:128 (+) comp30145_c0_seq2:36-419(+)
MDSTSAKRKFEVIDLTEEEPAIATPLKQAPKPARAPAPPSSKSAKVAANVAAPRLTTVWVIAKGDFPEYNSQLVDINVLGVYSSRARAETAKKNFLEEGNWEEGYGYHQGEGESTIKIFQKTIDAPC